LREPAFALRATVGKPVSLPDEAEHEAGFFDSPNGFKKPGL
jgi:hypothetical protein